jgi:hypothetical protein
MRLRALATLAFLTSTGVPPAAQTPAPRGAVVMLANVPAPDIAISSQQQEITND